MRFGHVGLTVSELDKSVKFYEGLGFKTFFRIRRKDAPWLDARVGIKNLDIEFCHMQNEEGVYIELLKYWCHADALPNLSFPCFSGHMHFSLIVADPQKYSGESIENTRIPDGPNAGKRGFYMQDPDGHTIEILEA